jgi:hypothetical protein
MVWLCRGLVLVTCAAPGRKEHGSSRRGPKFSLSSKLFGKYYENVCAEDLLAAGAEAWPRFDRCVLRTVGTDLQFYGVLK